MVSKSFRISPDWIEHLEDQVERLGKKLGRRVYAYEFIGTAFMNFSPADDVGDREIFEQFIRLEAVRTSVGDVSKLSDAEKAALRKLLK